MNTLKQTLSELTDESYPQVEHRITGFDGGTRPIFKEPSLYLSVFVVFMATFVCLNKTPILFGIAFISLSAITIGFHAMAERLLFRANKEYEPFAAPFEGAFALTLGAILPGISLLAYGIYALSKTAQPNFLDELGKLALLLIVPLFNFIVWKSVKKGYLIRPRIVGLMNGLALGLSASWTFIWIKSLLVPQEFVSCKFGWMMLLCVSPFMLIAAACLNGDLWRKTEPGISRVTTTFAILGGLLSMLFVFTPVVRSSFVQSLVMQAKQGPAADRPNAISTLRSLATPEDLRPSKHPIGGFSLASLLVSDRGLDGGTDVDKDVFFSITGKPFEDINGGSTASNNSSDVSSALTGGIIPGLSLAKSQIFGSIDSSTLSSSVDWTFAFHNSTTSSQEARAEMRLPKGAVVSKVTLWVNGEERAGVFAPTSSARQTYDSIVSAKMDPLLVTMPSADRVLVQCFPVPACGGGMKIRIGFKVPLETTDGKNCSLELPKLLSSNFEQPKRHRVKLTSRDTLVQNIAGLVIATNTDGLTTATGFIKPDRDSKQRNSIVTQRSTSIGDIAVIDPVSREKQYIVEQLSEVITPAPQHLSVVVDCSSSLRNEIPRIKEILASIPVRLKPTVYFAGEQNVEEDSKTEVSAKSLEKAQAFINPDVFVGGHNNLETMREVLESTAEQPHSAVLWIHGPQPTTQNLAESNALDLVHGVRLYDLQFGSGTNSVLRAIKSEDVSNYIASESLGGTDTAKDVKKLIAGWNTATKRLTVRRKLSTTVPSTPIVTDRLVSEQVASIWANEQVATHLESGRQPAALELATKYGILSEVTGGLVLDNPKDMAAFKVNSDKFAERFGRERSYESSNRFGPGLVGAPVDPRYGQSNEVGRLADFGYDTARDISRLMTAFSFLMSLGIGISSLRSRKELTWTDYLKTVALILIVPLAVHLLGTYMINNYGGLGGGL